MRTIEQVRKNIEEGKPPISKLLELAQPVVTKMNPTTNDWEIAELLLTRAVCQVKADPSTSLEASIRKMLAALMPAHARYRRYHMDHHKREQLIVEMGRLRYQLSHVTSFEQLVTTLLPQKRKLHQQLAIAFSDTEVLVQAIHFSLIMRYQFLSLFETFVNQLQVLVQWLEAQSPLAPEDQIIIEEIKEFCQSPSAGLSGPYEQNSGKFGQIFNLCSQLRKIARRYGLDEILKPTLAEQLEVKLKVQADWLASQVMPQFFPTLAMPKVLKMNQAPLSLKARDAAAMFTLSAQDNPRLISTQEVVSRGMALVEAIKDCRYESGYKNLDPESVRNYLHDQLYVATSHLGWLASRPCIARADVEFSVTLWQIRKKWDICLSGSQNRIEALSA